jgi:hypothetical protein
MTRAALAWLVVALVTGPALGASGGGWAAGGDRRRIAGVALLAGCLLAEAAQGYIAVGGTTIAGTGGTALQVALVDGLGAAALPIALLRPRHLPIAYGASLMVGAGGLAVLRLVLWAAVQIIHA